MLRTMLRVWDGIVPWDFRAFHAAGLLSMVSGNPYDQTNGTPALNPPTVLPLFKLFAAFEIPLAARLWTAANAVLLLLGPALAWRALRGSGAGSAGQTIPFPWAIAGITYLSAAALWGLDAGQLSFMTAAAMFAALCMRDSRPAMSGLALAIALAKPGTMIPVLTQFLIRRYRLTWVGLIAGGLTLASAGTWPSELPCRVRENLVAIGAAQVPGAMNDFGFEGTLHDDIISPSRWLYCMGLRDRATIAAGEVIILGIVLGWLVRVTLAVKVPPNASAAMACVAGCFFLYHRVYDAVAAVPAMVYCTAAARRETGWRRGLLCIAVVGLLMVLNMPRGESFRALASWSMGAGLLGQIVRAVVLPYAIWILLGTMVIIHLTVRAADMQEANR